MSIETFTFAEIQQEMLIPPSFVPRIVADLARGGLIVTFPGRDGSLQLAHPPAQINLRQVVEFFEGLADLIRSLRSQYDIFFDKTTFYKLYEDARGTNWGRQFVIVSAARAK